MARSGRPEWMLVEDLKQLQQQKRLDSLEAERMKMDKKAELRNLERRMQMERVEAEMEEKLMKEKEDALMFAAKREEEKKLAEDMTRLNQEQLREIKIRQQLRESCDELKQLEAKLRAAYVSKELAIQIAEKKAAALQEKVEKRRLQEAVESEQQCLEEQERLAYQAALADKLQYRIDLQDQIISAYKRQQDAYQQFIHEKALLDQLVRVIHEEDQKEQEMRMERMRKTKQEIEEFRRQQEIWKQREKEARDEEDRRIKEFLDQREKEEKLKLEQIKEKEEVKRKLQEQLQSALQSQQMRNLEREQVLEDLAAEEIKEKELQRVRVEMEQAVQRREELQRSYREQLAERRHRLQEEEAQQEVYRQQLLAQFAEDEKIEQLTAQKKRLKIIEHRRQVQELLEEKHRRRVEEWQQVAALERLQQAEEKQRAQLIEEERLRMLKKHATKLLGYLPRGVLRDDDLTHLGSEFLEEFNKFNTMNSARNNYVF